MANFMKNPDLIDVNIDQHEKYYNKLITLFPAMHEVYGTLGYLHYRNGNISTALSFYKKAMDLNPQFFWYPYDMAIIFMNNKRYQEAAALFQYALNVNPVNSVISIMQSKVYQQIFVGTGATMDLKNSIQNGVENAMAGLKFCTNNSNAEKNDPPALHVQIF